MCMNYIIYDIIPIFYYFYLTTRNNFGTLSNKKCKLDTEKPKMPL